MEGLLSPLREALTRTTSREQALLHREQVVQKVKKMRVQVWIGNHHEEQLRVGETQKIDGFATSDVMLEDAPIL